MIESGTGLARTVWMRWIFICLAWLCIVLGIIGVFIPGLPTVDFIILATFFAARGSKRLHQFLLSNRYIRQIVEEWQLNRRIPKKAKYLSTVSMSLAAAIMIWTIPHPWFVYPAILCMFCVLVWMWLKA
ncbi:YbaN family protein [Acinetobacter stercoris]|nr:MULTISPECIES: YbaN family protein [Acinetobacter]